jgi:hypothetical protein
MGTRVIDSTGARPLARGYAAAVRASWDIAFDAPATVIVYPGTFRVHGVGKYTTAQTTVTLTGATEWIYAKLTRAKAQSIAHQETEPDDSASADILKPLWQLTRTTAGGYTITRDCRHDVDM